VAGILLIALLIGRNPGFFGYLRRAPEALSGASLGWPVLAVGGLLLTGVACYGAVQWLLKLAARRGLAIASPLPWVLAALVVGGLASSWAVALLIGHGLPWVYLCLLAAGALAATVYGVAQRPRRLALPGEPGWQRSIVLGLCSYALLHGFVQMLVPQTAWDVLAYHLAIAKLYGAWGQMHEIPWMLHSHAPHLLQTFYALPVMLGADTVAAGVHFFCTLLLLGLTYSLGEQYLGKRMGALAAAVLLCQPVVYQYAGLAHSDAAFALFHLAATAALWRWQEKREVAWLWIGGVLSGLACASKLFGPVLSLALALWVLKRGRKAAVRPFLLAVAAVAGPWYVRTWINTGNPVWPWMSSFFGGDFGAAHVDAAFVASQATSWATLSGDLMRQGAHFLLVPLIALGLWRRRLSPLTRFLLWPVLLYAVFFVAVPSTGVWRYFFPLYPALVLAFVEWAKAVKKPVAYVAFAMALSPAVLAAQNNQLFAALSLKSQARPNAAPRELYLERSLDFFGFYQKVNAILGPQDKVMLWREIRGAHLTVPYLWGDPVNQGMLRMQRSFDVTVADSAARVRAQLQQLGVTHVLSNFKNRIYQPGASYYSKRDQAVMDQVLKDRVALLSENGLALYPL
jgi:hypothetical protein